MINIDNDIYLTYDDINTLITHSFNTLDLSSYKSCKKIIAVSKGGFVPAIILVNKLNLPVYTIGIKSYNGKTQSKIKEYQPLPKGVDANDALIVDDIVDTGKTIAYILNKYGYNDKTCVYSLVQNTVSTECEDMPPHWSKYCMDCAMESEGEWAHFPWELEDK